MKPKNTSMNKPIRFNSSAFLRSSLTVAMTLILLIPQVGFCFCVDHVHHEHKSDLRTSATAPHDNCDADADDHCCCCEKTPSNENSSDTERPTTSSSVRGFSFYFVNLVSLPADANVRPVHSLCSSLCVAPTTELHLLYRSLRI